MDLSKLSLEDLYDLFEKIVEEINERKRQNS